MIILRKKGYDITLVFLRFIGEKYEDGLAKLIINLKEQGLDVEDENIKKAFIEYATFTDGTYNLPRIARWVTIINTPAPKLNVVLNDALKSLADSDDSLKGCFVESTFTTRNLAPNSQYLHGYVTQVKQYGKAEKIDNMIYVFIAFGNHGRRKTLIDES